MTERLLPTYRTERERDERDERTRRGVSSTPAEDTAVWRGSYGSSSRSGCGAASELRTEKEKRKKRSVRSRRLRARLETVYCNRVRAKGYDGPPSRMNPYLVPSEVRGGPLTLGLLLAAGGRFGRWWGFVRIARAMAAEDGHPPRRRPRPLLVDPLRLRPRLRPRNARRVPLRLQLPIGIQSMKTPGPRGRALPAEIALAPSPLPTFVR